MCIWEECISSYCWVVFCIYLLDLVLCFLNYLLSDCSLHSCQWGTDVSNCYSRNVSFSLQCCPFLLHIFSWLVIRCLSIVTVKFSFHIDIVLINFIVVQSLRDVWLWPHGLASVLHYLLELAQAHVHWVDDAVQPSHPLLPSSSALHLSHKSVFSSESALHIR